MLMTFGEKFLRMDQVKFFKSYLPKILFGPFLNTFPNFIVSYFFRWLLYSLDSTKVRSQDTVYVIHSVAAGNTVGKSVAWNFAKEHWNEIMDM